MIFTLDHIVNSLAGVLKAQYPDYPVYANANQQGTKYPCFFIFFMPSTIESRMDDHFYRDLGVDIVFVQQRNTIDGNSKLQGIAEYLDEHLEIFAYSDGNGETVWLRTYERQWQTEDQELHYQFHIRQRMALSRTEIPMREMEANNAGIKKE